MMRRLQRKRLILLAVLAGAVSAAGCGDDEDFANTPRPPNLVRIDAVISAEAMTVSPERFGAGPIDLRITNQTDSSQQVILRSGDGTPTRLEQRTGPINPSDTASLSADLAQGSYVLEASPGQRVEPATITVGAPRASAKDQLLQP